MKAVVVFFVVGVVFTFLTRPLKRKIGLAWAAIFAAHLAIFACLGPDPFVVVHLVPLVVVLVCESRFPRVDYKDTEAPGEWLRNAAYIFLKAAPRPLNAYLLAFAFGGIDVPWGLARHHWPFWAQCLVAVTVIDFYVYWLHRLRHTKLLWPFHRVHHFNQSLTSVCHGRNHIIEYFVTRIFLQSIPAILLGLDPNAVALGYGVPALVFALISHANIDYPRKKMDVFAYFFVTPNSHAVHHAKETMLYNFAEIFNWDILLGTWKSPVTMAGRLNDFGVPGEISPDSIWAEQFVLARKVASHEQSPVGRLVAAPAAVDH